MTKKKQHKVGEVAYVAKKNRVTDHNSDGGEGGGTNTGGIGKDTGAGVEP